MIRVATLQFEDGSPVEAVEFSKGKVAVQLPDGDMMIFQSWDQFTQQLLTPHEKESIRDLYRREF